MVCAVIAGSSTVTRIPPAGRGVRVRVPPCASVIVLTMARPSPTPAWSVCMRMTLSGFYSHPWAWNEIGFGGPAYPRGFMRLGGATGSAAAREPYETRGATDEDPVQIVNNGEL